MVFYIGLKKMSKTASLSLFFLTLALFLTALNANAQFVIANGLPGCLPVSAVVGQNCDGGPFQFGINASNQMVVQNIDGTSCCPGPNGGGNSGSYFEFELLNIIDFTNVFISLNYSASNTTYEDNYPGGPVFTCVNAAPDNQHDLMLFTYSIDGGVEFQSLYVHGTTQATFTGTWNAGPINGNTLKIRIYASNKEAAEIFFFQNLLVTGTPKLSAGPDDTICPGEIADLNGSYVGTWTGGLGSITSPVSTITNYTPVPSEYGSTVTLTYTGLNAAYPGCPIPSDQMNVIIRPFNDPSFVFNTFCVNGPNGPTDILSPGGIFSFDPDPGDGATINPVTGEISNEVANVTYTVRYSTPDPCPQTTTRNVTVTFSGQAFFTFDDFCVVGPNGPSFVLNPDGVFSFNPLPTDGATINPITGVISNPTAGTTYTIQKNIFGNCPSVRVEEVTVIGQRIPEIDLGPFCSIAGLVELPPAVDGIAGFWTGPNVNGLFFNADTAPGTYTLTFTPGFGECALPNSFDVEVFLSPRGFFEEGPIFVCPEQCEVVNVEFLDGVGPYDVDFTISGIQTVPYTASGLTNSNGINICLSESEISFDPVTNTMNLLVGNYTFELKDFIDFANPNCTRGKVISPNTITVRVQKPYVFNGNLAFAECDYDGDGIAIHNLLNENTGIISINEGQAVTIRWFTDPGLTMPVPNPTALQYMAGDRLYYTVTTSGGCVASDFAIGQIVPGDSLPSLEFKVCKDGNVFQLPPDINGFNGVWTGPNVSSNKFDPQGLPVGVYLINFTPFSDCLKIEPSKVIIVPNEGIIQIPPLPPVCEGKDSLILPPIVNGYTGVWSGPFVTNNIFNATAAGFENSPYTLTFSPDPGDFCLEPNTIEIEVIPNIDLDSIVFPDICQGLSSYELGNSLFGVEGSWSGPNVVNNIFDPTGPVGEYQLIFSIKDNECINPSKGKIKVVAKNNITPIELGPTCTSGATFPLENIVEGFLGTWTYNNNLIIEFNPNAFGPGSFKLTFTPDVDQCALPFNTKVIVGSISAGENKTVSQCELLKTPINLKALLAGNVTQTGVWKYNNIEIPNPEAFNTALLNPGVSNILYVIDDAQCGKDTAFVTLNIAKLNEAGTNQQVKLCSNNLNEVDFTTWSGSQDEDGIWKQINNTTLDLTDLEKVDMSSLDPGSYGFEYVVEADICPGDTSRLTFDIAKQNNAGPDIVSNVCQGDTLELKDLINPNFLGGTIENFNNITGVTSTSWNTNDLPSASYQFRYVTTSSDPCVNDTAFFNLILNETVNAGPDINQVFCEGQNINLTTYLSASTSKGGTFFYNGVAIVGNVFIPDNINDATIIYKVGDNINCPVDESELKFSKIALPNIDAAFPVNICSGQCQDITIIHNIPIGSTAFFTLKATSGQFFKKQLVINNSDPIVFNVCSSDNLPNTFENLPLNTDIELELDSVQVLSGSCVFEYGDLGSFRTISLPEKTINGSLCEGETLVVGNDIYSFTRPSGTSVVPDITNVGCDSLIYVELTFNVASPDNFITVTTCNQTYNTLVGTETFDINNPKGEVLLQNRFGCDSLVNVDLKFSNFSLETIQETTCDPSLIKVVGDSTFTKINPSGRVVFTNGSVFGCDSIVDVNLRYLDASTFEFSKQTCDQNFSYTVGGVTFNRNFPSSSVTLNGQANNGCDSIVIVNLEFLPFASGTFDTSTCDPNYVLELDGVKFDKDKPSGPVLLQGASVLGCDSLLNVTINFLNIPTKALDLRTCNQDSIFLIGDQSFDKSRPNGLVTLNHASSNGCDSILDVNILFLAPQNGNFNFATCDENFNEVIGGTLFNKSNTSGLATIRNGAKNGCDSVVSVNLTFKNLDFSSATKYFCDGNDAMITLENANLNGPYQIELNGQIKTTVDALPFAISVDPGENITSIVTPDGCTASKTTVVQDNTKPEVELVKIPINIGVDQINTLVSNNEIYNLSWTPSTTLSCKDCLDPIASPTVTTIYELTYNYGVNCSDKRTIQLDRKNIDIVIPDIFSPNGDNTNDLFYLNLPEGVEAQVSEMSIYDRWGNLVFQSKSVPASNPAFGWDGNFNGRALDSGVFVYYIEVELAGSLTSEKFYGSITLLR